MPEKNLENNVAELDLLKAENEKLKTALTSVVNELETLKVTNEALVLSVRLLKQQTQQKN